MPPSGRSSPAAAASSGGRLLTAGDVAARLGVTKRWVYAEARAGRIPHIRLGPRYIRFRGLFGLTVDMPHFLTNANAGVDTNHDLVVNSLDKAEANPVYRESIDLPGRRFRVEETEVWSLLLEGSIMF